MYVITINNHEVFLDIEFASVPNDFNPMVTKCDVITGFSPNGAYIVETAPDWLKGMIEDTNLLYWDIVGQDEPTITVEVDPETWACLSLHPEQLGDSELPPEPSEG